jgi:hypothetical protein
MLLEVDSVAPKQVRGLALLVFEGATDEIIFFTSRCEVSLCCLLSEESLVDELGCWSRVNPIVQMADFCGGEGFSCINDEWMKLFWNEHLGKKK